MKTKNIVGILLVMVFCNTVFCQIDTPKIKLVAKSLVFLNLPFGQVNENNFFRFIKEDIQVEFVSSKGFNSAIVFVRIENIDKQAKGINITDGGCFIPYIIAIDKRDYKFYRIYGFVQNDLLQLLSNNTIGKQINSYSVGGIDIKCIYEGLREKKINYDKYPCLKFCGQVESIK